MKSLSHSPSPARPTHCKLMSWWTSFFVVDEHDDDIFLLWIKISFNVRLFAKWWLVFFVAAAAICFCLFHVVNLYFFLLMPMLLLLLLCCHIYVRFFHLLIQFSDCGRLASAPHTEATHIPFDVSLCVNNFMFFYRKSRVDRHTIIFCIETVLCSICDCCCWYLCFIWKFPIDIQCPSKSWLYTQLGWLVDKWYV